jgi:hypothetical protein
MSCNNSGGGLGTSGTSNLRNQRLRSDLAMLRHHRVIIASSSCHHHHHHHHHHHAIIIP